MQSAIKLLQTGGDVVLPEGLSETYGLGDLLAAASPMTEPVTSITIPNSYVYLTIGSGCEELETVENLYVQENNPCYRSVDGVLFSLDGETLILFPPGRTGIYTVPDGVKYIGGRAFEYSQLTELYLSDSVERLGMYACDLMENLREISLPRRFVGGLDGCLPHTPSDPQNGQPNTANLLRENVSVVYRGMAAEWDNVSFSDIIIPPNQVLLVNETT